MAGSSELRTNRDLYLFVADLCEKNAKNDRSLEDFLKVLWRLSSPHRSLDALPLSQFAGLLEAALREEVPSFDPSWTRAYQQGEDQLAGYVRWESTILGQIVDLHEMERAGTLANDLRYFGVDAPRGSRWYNFDPLTFLECAVTGTFGGWRSGDPTGRDYVPGPVAVLDETGRITSADPRELDEPLFEMEGIGWDVFADFLGSGQWYE